MLKERSFRREMSELLCRISYILPVVLTAIFSYGYSIAHLSISTDDLTADRYTTWDSVLFSQGRFTAVIMKRFFGLIRPVPFFGNLLCILLFIIAAMIFCVVMQRAASGKLKPSALTVFSCILISYSLINEIYVYNGGNINVCVGYCLTALSVYFAQKYYIEKKFSSLLYSMLIMVSVVSLYESFCSVYVMMIIIILILEFYYSEDQQSSRRFFKVLLRGMIALAPLLVAIILEFAIGKVANAIFAFPETEYAVTSSLWLDSELTRAEIFNSFMREILFYYVFAFPYYLPIKTLLITVAAVIVWLIVEGIRHRNVTISMLFVAMLIMLMALSLISGRVSPARTCQHYAIFVGFFVMLAYQQLLETADRARRPSVKKIVTYATCFLAFVLIFYQANDLNAWLCLDVQRYEEEKRVLETVGDKLNAEYDVANKPVAFVGQYTISSQIREQCTVRRDSPVVVKTAALLNKIGMTDLAKTAATLDGNESFKYVRNNLNSYIFWASLAFNEPNTELLKFYRMLGYYFEPVDPVTFDGCLFQCNLMAEWPDPESIVELDECIIVNFGRIVDLEAERENGFANDNDE